MTEPTELMPCPFCGGNARKVKHSAGSPGTTGYDRWHGVACAGCNACVGARDRRFRTSSAAIAAWNRRTPQPTQAQAGAVPLTDREIELIDGMIAVQLDHAMRCDAIANRAMADKQKGWDMERVALLQKLKAAHSIKGGQHG